MGVFNNIQNALNVKLNSLSGIPTIYWPNTQNEPTAGTNWLRPTLLPAASRPETLTNGNYHSGIYQVDIYTSLKKGTSEAFLIADTIREGFNRQRLANNGTIVNIVNVSVSTARRDEGWWNVFVEISYICVA
jgi:hypothetical protein